MRRTPMALAPLIIRWGDTASSDMLRRSARCMRCGAKGATIRHPSWGGPDSISSRSPSQSRAQRIVEASRILGIGLRERNGDEQQLEARIAILDLDFSDVATRLLAAVGAGALVGLNRDLADKPIGVRTLGLVSLGAATVSVAAIQVQGMAENPDALSRVVQGIIQGVMAGISFIGAGVILRNAEKRSVEGLTTAATVWVSASLGVACGLGAWRTIAIAIPITLAMLFAVGWVDQLTKRRRPDE